MPRKVVFHSKLPGDPQTLLQGDRDPMLTMQPDYLDCRPDPDPAGDLGKNMGAGSSAAWSQFSSLLETFVYVLKLYIMSIHYSVGVRFPVYKAMSRDQIPPPPSDPVTEARTPEIDVSDLGSRSYAARTDFYCLVSDDI